MPTVKNTLSSAQAKGIDRLDAQLLLLHALGRSPNDRAWLISHDTDALSVDQINAFEELCVRRNQGEPVAYLIGQREFYGLMLQVNSSVLDPRPDTETLVDWAIEFLAANQDKRVLDLGTGSGAIALAIASQRSSVKVSAVDLSADALAVARANGLRLGLNIDWRQGSWFEPVTSEQFDLIVSNPPYIREDDPHMARLSHEPRMALTSGASGMDDIKRIIQEAPSHMKSGASLLIEHGYDQAADVAQLFAEHGFADIQHRHDLAGIERCTGGQKP